MASDIAVSDGSVPLPRKKHEIYARERALFKSPADAALAAGYERGSGAHSKLERNASVQRRVAYLSRQEAEVIAEIRNRLLAREVLILEQDIGDLYEETEEILFKDGQPLTRNGEPVTRTVTRPKLFSDMTREQRQLIESYTVTETGKPNLKLHSSQDAHRELRKMLGLDKPVAAGNADDDAFRNLTLAEKIAQIDQDLAELRKIGPILNHDGASEPSA